MAPRRRLVPVPEEEELQPWSERDKVNSGKFSGESGWEEKAGEEAAAAGPQETRRNGHRELPAVVPAERRHLEPAEVAGSRQGGTAVRVARLPGCPRRRVKQAGRELETPRLKELLWGRGAAGGPPRAEIRALEETEAPSLPALGVASLFHRHP